jgi:outer membrane protein
MKSRSMKYSVFLMLFLFIAKTTSAQHKWSFEECIVHARENSLSILQARGNSRLAEINRQAAQESRYPSLNFSTNYGLRFGRTIDPTTNAFETSTLNTNGLSLNTSLLLYNGNRLNHTIYQSKIDLEAARKDQEQISNNLALDIASLYLSIILSKENLRVAENNLALSKNQYDQIDILVRNGVRPIGEKYEAESQLLLQEQTLINSQNAVMIGLLNLAQLLLIDDYSQFDIQDIDIEIDESVLTMALPQLYQNALSTQPQIAAAKMRVHSSQYNSKIAKSGYYPTVALFANMNTNYSSLSRQIDR